MNLENYVSGLDGFANWEEKRKVDYLAYFLTQQGPDLVVTSTQIEKSFSTLDIRPYSRIAAYFSEEAKSKTGKYLKQKTGYRLERKTFDEIKRVVENEPKMIQVSRALSDLLLKVKDSQEESFLQEAINCYKVEAFRASIVMVWTLVLDHLHKYIFGNKLSEFNRAILKDSDKRLKEIVQYDDFSNIKEVKLIELMRSAGIISNDIKKILDVKLGIRNSAAHPSGISFSGSKATEFIIDLVDNILLKY
jgi:hypothetical protein